MFLKRIENLYDVLFVMILPLLVKTQHVQTFFLRFFTFHMSSFITSCLIEKVNTNI